MIIYQWSTNERRDRLIVGWHLLDFVDDQYIERQLFVNELQTQLILQCLEHEWRTGR